MFLFEKFLFLICIHMHFVFTCDESESDVTDTSFISAEYSNIFQTIPTLFEYVMNLIEQKPEILEKDDVTVFTRDISVMGMSDEEENVVERNFKQSLDSDEDDNEDDYELDGYPGFDFWDWYIGAVESMSLTSTEIAEKALEIERELEQFNANES